MQNKLMSCYINGAPAGLDGGRAESSLTGNV